MTLQSNIEYVEKMIMMVIKTSATASGGYGNYMKF